MGFPALSCNADVLYFYRQIPLLWRAVVELGCVCSVKPQAALARSSANEARSRPASGGCWSGASR